MAHETEKTTPNAETDDVEASGAHEHTSKDEDVSRTEGSEVGEEGELEETAPPLPDEAVPPLPNEEAPPLPNEAPPGQTAEDDGWAPMWDDNAQAYYFYNRFTGLSQWENPRVPDATATAPAVAPGTEDIPKPPRPAGGYDPAIHGDYDPNADYAKIHETNSEETSMAQQTGDPAQMYAATGAFNRFTGKWQAATITPDNYNDEAKSGRQMNAFFDVDAAANAHDGRSLKAERSAKKLSKKEVKAFREKRREKKEEKRRAWLRD